VIRQIGFVKLFQATSGAVAGTPAGAGEQDAVSGQY